MTTADSFAAYSFPCRLLAGPDGQAAFLVRQANLDENRYNSDLWLLPPAGAPRRLTHDTRVEKFWWLPDGALVFARLVQDADKQTREDGLPLTVLHRLDIAAPGEAAEWLRLSYDVEELHPLADGRILFTAQHDPMREEILAQAGGDKALAKTRLEKSAQVTQLYEHPFWEDGGGFTGGKRRRLWLWDGAQAIPLSDTTTDVEQLRAAPEGNCVFFIARQFEKTDTLTNQLMQLSLDTLQAQDISPLPYFCHTAYVPLADSSLLLFGSTLAEYGMNQNGNFYRMELPQRLATPLYEGGGYNGWDAISSDLKMPAPTRWQAREGNVYFVSTLNESTQMVRIDTQLGKIDVLTQQAGCVSELALCAGRTIFTALRGQGGAEIYELLPSGEEAVLSRFNDTLAKTAAWQEPQPFAVENSEGVSIQGWALRPANFSTEETYPAILYIHGGPKTAYGAVAFHEMQFLAAKGFGVLFCNPTGSDGRGDEFADLRGRYGLVDYDDLMRFVDAALQQNEWIDPARLGVAGGSYGGFMTNWIVGHTDRFSAAVSQRGISNWMSMAFTSDIGLWFVPDQIGSDPLDDPTALWDASPLKYAAAATTPTLFLHSEQDYRCPLGESLQMYSALHSHGVETKLVLFHKESHELSRSGRPKNRVRRLEEIAAWFGTHLAAQE